MVFRKSLRSCALEESSLSIEALKEGWILSNPLMLAATKNQPDNFMVKFFKRKNSKENI